MAIKKVWRMKPRDENMDEILRNNMIKRWQAGMNEWMKSAVREPIWRFPLNLPCMCV